MKPFKQLHRSFRSQGACRFNHGLDIGKSPSLRFLHPFLRIPISIENNPVMLGQILFNQIMHGHVEIIRFFQNIRRFAESLRYNGIQCNIRACHRIRGTYHTEFKLVPRKSKG